MQDILDKMVGMPLSSMRRHVNTHAPQQVHAFEASSTAHGPFLSKQLAVGQATDGMLNEVCAPHATMCILQAAGMHTAVDTDDLAALGWAAPGMSLGTALQCNALQTSASDLAAGQSQVFCICGG